MKKILAAAIALATLAACAPANSEVVSVVEPFARFDYIKCHVLPYDGYIITDNKTGYEYLCVTHSAGIGLTRLDELPDIEEPESEPESLGWFEVTAYCACKDCCGKSPGDKGYGITATGTVATEGRTIAVDPKVIPYGTEVQFIGPDGEMHTYVAEDTGGAVKGRSIDLYFASHQEAREWGKQSREVFKEVLNDG